MSYTYSPGHNVATEVAVEMQGKCAEDRCVYVFEGLTPFVKQLVF
jgi:hypothetical protein